MKQKYVILRHQSHPQLEELQELIESIPDLQYLTPNNYMFGQYLMVTSSSGEHLAELRFKGSHDNQVYLLLDLGESDCDATWRRPDNTSWLNENRSYDHRVRYGSTVSHLLTVSLVNPIALTQSDIVAAIVLLTSIVDDLVSILKQDSIERDTITLKTKEQLKQ